MERGYCYLSHLSAGKIMENLTGRLRKLFLSDSVSVVNYYKSLNLTRLKYNKAAGE